MNDQDEFAVWLATTVLEANGDAFGAAALAEIGAAAGAGGGLDAALGEASAQAQRPGDFGVEFVGPLLPVLLVEFGRLLWNAYAKALVEESGKSLAKATVEGVKGLAHRTFAQHEGAALTAADADAILQQAAQAAGLTAAQTAKFREALQSREAVRALAGG